MSEAVRRTVLEDSAERSSLRLITKAEIRSRIREIGVLPSLRICSADEAVFVANTLAEAGIPFLEIAANTPGAIEVIAHVAANAPNTIVAAGSVASVAAAERCLAEGARFLTSDALLLPLVEFAVKENVVVLPGAFTPTEILAASSAGADFVKVVPCDAAGGESYIRSVKAALPDISLVAAGGVTQSTAQKLIAAGATGIGVSRELIPAESIRLRQARRIKELARRFLSFVDTGRIDAAGRGYVAK